MPLSGSPGRSARGWKWVVCCRPTQCPPRCDQAAKPPSLAPSPLREQLGLGPRDARNGTVSGARWCAKRRCLGASYPLSAGLRAGFPTRCAAGKVRRMACRDHPIRRASSLPMGHHDQRKVRSGVSFPFLDNVSCVSNSRACQPAVRCGLPFRPRVSIRAAFSRLLSGDSVRELAAMHRPGRLTA